MTGMEFELGMLMYRTVLRSLKDNCEERDCDKCVFADGYGVCILAVTPNKYDIEKIQDAIRRNVRESGENRWV
jgi:hypothetical protein